MVNTTFQNHYGSLILGIVMCIGGLAIFAYLSPVDFLEPGFVIDGVLIQDQYVSPNDSFESTIFVTKEGQEVTVSVTNPMSEVPLRLEIKDPEGMTINNIDSSNEPKITFKTENVGKYTVTLSNVGTELTKITMQYGHSIHNTIEQETNAILGASWIILIILGSYLILHTDFTILTKERK